MSRSSIEVGGGIWRYHLNRRWDDALPFCTFVMLNPSTANGEHDDPTIRACVRWAEVLGCGNLHVVNLFAYRSSSPARLLELTREDAVGQFNDRWIRQTCYRAEKVICAWGAHKAAHGRDVEVIEMLQKAGHELWCLGTNDDGTPRHPLARGKHRIEIKAEHVRRFP